MIFFIYSLMEIAFCSNRILLKLKIMKIIEIRKESFFRQIQIYKSKTYEKSNPIG